MAISDQAFVKAQQAELGNWKDDAANASRILHELTEHSDVADALRAVLNSRRVGRALEVGIGPYGLGFLAVHLSVECEAIDGIEPLPRLDLELPDRALTSYVKAIQQRVNYIQSTAEKLPLESNTFDLIACINVIDHTQDPQAIIHEIGRVLKPGGLFVFGVNTLSTLGEAKWKFNRSRNPTAFIFVAHPHTYQWKAADQLVRQIPGRVLWTNRPTTRLRVAGHGQMSFWILQKQ